MTLMKSLLLGSAATLVVVAGAQAADLPTKKGAPVAEYVKVCKIDGMAGFVIPGSDTCLKITGYMTAQFTAGNLSTGLYELGRLGRIPPQAVLAPVGRRRTAPRHRLHHPRRTRVHHQDQHRLWRVDRGHRHAVQLRQRLRQHRRPGRLHQPRVRQLGRHHRRQGELVLLVLRRRRGLGEHRSRPTSRASTSPSCSLTPRPSAAASRRRSPRKIRSSAAARAAASTCARPRSTPPISGLRAPDIVASLDLVQSWGGAHLAGVAHYVNVTDAPTGFTQNVWGWGVDGGLKFNLPQLGAGDIIEAQAEWSRNAVWYSGLPDGLWGELGAINGNGVAMPMYDTWSNFNGTWATPTAWAVSAFAEFHFGVSSRSIRKSPTARSTGPATTCSAYGPACCRTTRRAGWAARCSTGIRSRISTSTSSCSTRTPISRRRGLIVGLAILLYAAPASKTARLAWPGTSSGLEGRFEVTRDF